MTTPSDIDEQAIVRDLRIRIGELEQRVASREKALSQLNHRLLKIENGTDPQSLALQQAHERIEDFRRHTEFLESTLEARDSELVVAHAEIARRIAELERMEATKLFRYADPARRVYRLLRRMR